MGEELTTELGSVLRKHAKNVAGSRPVGQDHKEAFVLGGVQGVDGQNSRGGGQHPLWVRPGEDSGVCTVPTHHPLLSVPPPLAPAVVGSIRPRLQGREPLGPGYPPSQLLTSHSLAGALSQIQPF